MWDTICIRYGNRVSWGRNDELIGFGRGLGFLPFPVGYVDIWSFKTVSSLSFLAFFLSFYFTEGSQLELWKKLVS